MPRGTRTPIHVRQRIEQLAIAHDTATAAAITRELERDKEFAALVPEERTVQAIVRQARTAAPQPRTPGGTWSLIDCDAQEAQLALPVMREMNRPRSGGTLGWNLSKDVVRWIAKVRIADPTFGAPGGPPLREAFFQALRYLQAERGVRGASAELADRYLVLELYREKETQR